MTPDEMRATAKTLVTGAVARLKAATLTEAEQVQVSVITDQVNAFTLVAFADAIDTINPDQKELRAKEILDRHAAEQDALRKAAAKAHKDGNWSDFDKLVDRISNNAAIAAGLGDPPVAGVTGNAGSP